MAPGPKNNAQLEHISGVKNPAFKAGYDVYATPEHKEVKVGLIGDFARLPGIQG
jgi:hypothetical protein